MDPATFETPDTRTLMLELAHELQTPLAVLKCRVARLRDGLVRDAPGADEAVQIDALIDSISAGIAEFIVSAACPQGEASMKPFSLSELVAEVVEEAGVIADAAGIALTARIAADVAFTGNRSCVRDALRNLLANALKYIGDGPRKEVSLTLDHDRVSAVLAIADTGIGIPETDLPHIFERHYRGQQQYGLAPGLGLGLSIVERAVESHRGSIEATSVLGAGTTFILRFPVAGG